MRALIDFHHTDLAESLHRLLEDRLGLEVCIPHGMDWRDEGVWRFGQGYPDGGVGVARQFLWDDREVDDLQPHRRLRRITYEEARGMDFAVVLATVPDNYAGYKRFADEKGARFGIEVGNVNQWVDRSLDPLILDSTGQYPGGVPFTPEFDMDEAFAFDPLPAFGFRSIMSFVNLFPNLPCWTDFAKTHLELGPTWQARIHGHNGPDGFVKPTSEIGALMRMASFAWHDKITGDGFGYVIHYWASVGRPLIGHSSHYRGQVAEDLWVDGVTCIDLDLHDYAETAKLMLEIVSDAERHQEMCFEIARRVRERIDFQADAERVANALGLAVAA